jgi:hypothetical protein
VTIAMAVGAATIAQAEQAESVFDVMAREDAARVGNSPTLATLPKPTNLIGESATVSDDADEADDDRIDEAILANPRHPQWQAMRERWELQNMSVDDDVF